MEFVEEGADSAKKVRGFYRAQKYLWNGDILFFGIRPPGGSPHQDLYDDRSSKLQEQGRKSHRKDGLGWEILQRQHRPGADVPEAGVQAHGHPGGEVQPHELRRPLSQEEAQQKSANGNGKKRQYAEPWIFHGTGPPALTRTEKADIIFWIYYTRYFPAGQVRQSNIEGEI